MTFQTQPPPLPPDLPSNQPPGGGIKKVLGILGAIGVVIMNFGGKLKFILAPLLKFFPVILKSGGSMLLMIGVYTSMWGWKYAVGFVVLLLVHECGHLVVAKYFGLNVGAPVFIPFMGAFIALKDAPKNAWIESWVGIGGPLLGSAGALACHLAGLSMDIPLLIALAWTGYWLNLFNLTPIGQLDGGRIVTAISPWLWIPGVGVLGYMAWTHFSIILLLVLALAIPRLISLFRKRTEEEQRFYEILPSQRVLMATMYFGLIAALAFAMFESEKQLREGVPEVRHVKVPDDATTELPAATGGQRFR